MKRRQWIYQRAYAHLMSLCHFIPRSSSSQVGLGIVYSLRGWQGVCAAWLGYLALGFIDDSGRSGSIAQYRITLQLSYPLFKNCCLSGGSGYFASEQGVITEYFVSLFMFGGCGHIVACARGEYSIIARSGDGGIGWVCLKPEDIQSKVEPQALPYRSLFWGCGLFAVMFWGLFLAAAYTGHPIIDLVDSMFLRALW